MDQQALNMSPGREENKYAFQDEVVQRVVDDLMQGYNPLVVMPTGTGKSHVIQKTASEAARLGWRVLCLTNRKLLLEQNHKCATTADTGEFTIGKDHGKSSAGDADVVYSTIQTVLSKKDGWDPDRGFDLVIHDEAHHISFLPEYAARKKEAWLRQEAGEVDAGDRVRMYGQIYDHFTALNPDVRFMGLTATPGRNVPGRGMVHIFGHEGTIFNRVSADLTDAGSMQMFRDLGVLVPVEYYRRDALPPGFNAEKLNQVLADLVRFDPRTKPGPVSTTSAITVGTAVADAMCASPLCTDRCSRILLVVDSMVAAEYVAARLSSQGIAAEAVHSGRRDRDNAVSIGRFRSGEIRCLVSVDMLTEGFDAPCANMLIDVRRTKSAIAFYQRKGRIERCCAGKTSAVYIDLAGNLGTFDPGRPFSDYCTHPDKPLTADDFRTDGKRQGLLRLCRWCGGTSPVAATHCANPACGEPFDRDVFYYRNYRNMDGPREGPGGAGWEVGLGGTVTDAGRHWVKVTGVSVSVDDLEECVEYGYFIDRRKKQSISERFYAAEGITDHLRCHVLAFHGHVLNPGLARESALRRILRTDEPPVVPLAVQYIENKDGARQITGYRVTNNLLGNTTP